MLTPYKGRVHDPCCGSGGMFVQSEKFIEAYSGRIGDISIYGEESNYTTWRLAKMNFTHRHPFDRMLAAQALLADLVVVSNETRSTAIESAASGNPDRAFGHAG
jgi:hypothetical protein